MSVDVEVPSQVGTIGAEKFWNTLMVKTVPSIMKPVIVKLSLAATAPEVEIASFPTPTPIAVDSTSYRPLMTVPLVDMTMSLVGEPVPESITVSVVAVKLIFVVSTGKGSETISHFNFFFNCMTILGDANFCNPHVNELKT